MKSKDYWEKRSAAQLVDLLKNADDVIKELKLSYDKAIFNINTSIEKLYGKFAEDNRISINEAMKIIKGQEYREWRMSMQEYLKRIERGEEPLQLELDVLAMRSRINRLDCLQAEIIANATILAQDEDKTATEHLTDALESSYNNTMYEFYKDKDPAVLDLMNRHKVAISKDSVKEILQIPWSGANYSTRIWKRKFNIANKVKEMVTRNILEGKSINNITREVAKEFGAEYTNALKTLIHTETAFVKSQADKEVYNKLGVEEYEFMATLDIRTSEICRKLDGKHFKVDEAVPGENYPPMHPRCRSTTIRYKPEKYDTHTRMARDKDGKNIKVPLGMKYDEWYEKYIKNGEKGNLPIINTDKQETKKEETKKAKEKKENLSKDIEKKVEDKKQAESKPKERKPTSDELETIEYYVSGDGMYINDYLRNRNTETMGPMDSEDKEFIRDLEKATDRKHSHKKLYRSVDASAVFGKITERQWDDLREQLIYDMNKKAEPLIKDAIGKEIEDKGFMSTTKDYNVAVEFGYFTGADHPIVIEFSNADKVKGFDLGKYMPDLNRRMEQEEVLLHNDARYLVKDIVGKDGGIHVLADFLTEKDKKKENSNNQLYKQAGNAIVVDVLAAIFVQLFN
ncbi:minor capsid protein [Finegoldia magna]|uniref:minor capsid protein n=1 Tax=Finegoldia magna TaxID=1260 RepID=UPI00370D1236